MNNNIEVYELGLMDYEKVVKIQTELFNKIIDQKLKNRREKTKNKTFHCDRPAAATTKQR